MHECDKSNGHFSQDEKEPIHYVQTHHILFIQAAYIILNV